MGKGGVLWGRLDMNTQDSQRVIYRRNRTIYRREIKNLSTSRDARGFYFRDCLRLSWSQRFDLAIARGHLRKESQLARTIPVARRGCNGVRTNSLFTIQTNRNRQSGSHSTSRDIVVSCRNCQSSIRTWRRRSFRNTQSKELECQKERKLNQTSRNDEACSTEEQFKRWSINNFIPISAEQGRSEHKRCSATDGTNFLFETEAAKAAQHEPRMAHSRESICTDARY